MALLSLCFLVAALTFRVVPPLPLPKEWALTIERLYGFYIERRHARRSSAQRASLAMLVLLIAAYLLPSWAQLTPDVGYEGGGLVLAQLLCFLHCSIAIQVPADSQDPRHIKRRRLQVADAYIFSLEALGRGVGWSSMRQSPTKKDQFGGVQECLVLLLVQTVLYFLLSLYAEAVAPSKYGAKKPWYYPLVFAFVLFK